MCPVTSKRVYSSAFEFLERNNVQNFISDIKLRKERLKNNLDVFQEFEEQLKLRKQRDTKDLNRLNKIADSVMLVNLL